MPAPAVPPEVPGLGVDPDAPDDPGVAGVAALAPVMLGLTSLGSSGVATSAWLVDGLGWSSAAGAGSDLTAVTGGLRCCACAAACCWACAQWVKF